MRIDFEYRNNICLVRLHGRFQIGTTREFKTVSEELRRTGIRRVIVDCAEVPYFDSAALAFVIGLHNMLGQESGGWIALASVSDSAKEILRMTRLDEAIPMFRDSEHAFSSVRRAMAAA